MEQNKKNPPNIIALISIALLVGLLLGFKLAALHGSVDIFSIKKDKQVVLLKDLTFKGYDDHTLLIKKEC